MKFLFLYKYDPNYAFDSYFHLDLVDHFNKAGHESKCYGPKVHQKYGSSCIREYSQYLTLEVLYDIFPFDILIVLTKSRCFLHYRPPLVIPNGEEEREGCWLPKDFKDWKKPKIMIEEDFHYENSTEWYRDMRFDVVFQRHKNSMSRFEKINRKQIYCDWLPFSVDTDLFKPESSERTNKLCLKASLVPHIYPNRQMLFDKLWPDLIVHENHRKEYIKCLQSYTGHVCCSSIFDITPAKMFEIMASGSVLFTNEGNYGIDTLFDSNSYVTYNEKNCVSEARKILNESNWVNEITSNARSCILKRHTHQKRIKEMIYILNEAL